LRRCPEILSKRGKRQRVQPRSSGSRRPIPSKRRWLLRQWLGFSRALPLQSPTLHALHPKPGVTTRRAGPTLGDRPRSTHARRSRSRDAQSLARHRLVAPSAPRMPRSACAGEARGALGAPRSESETRALSSPSLYSCDSASATAVRYRVWRIVRDHAIRVRRGHCVGILDGLENFWNVTSVSPGAAAAMTA